MRILKINKSNYQRVLKKITSIREKHDYKTENIVKKIIDDVKKNGDAALIKYEKKFNQNNKIFPSRDRINKSIRTLSPKLKTAIKETYNRIIAWHKLQKKKDI